MQKVSNFTPVIMSGGSGTRLWPVSRRSHPKQFADLFGVGLSESLFAKTVRRFEGLTSNIPATITTAELKTLTLKTYSALGVKASELYLEPMARNTAAAVALVCRQMIQTPKQVVGIFPADHLIADIATFQKTVATAIQFANQGKIVTLGIRPTHPATGYGYIEAKASAELGARLATRFCEKPKLELAKEFCASGNYFWNAGMFVFQVETMVKALEKHAPEIWTHFQIANSSLPLTDSEILKIYEKVPKTSIDFAVMEKLESHITIPSDFGWSDVGSWDALSEVAESQTSIQIESQKNFIRSTLAQDKSYALVGVEDLIVVDTQDALLIAKKGSTEKTKDVVDRLALDKNQSVATRATQTTFETRPWGRFEILKDTAEFKSKIIEVDAGAQLSYQSHEKRSEHWMILNGIGEVVLNDQIIKVSPGQHVYIPVKTKHRMRNTGSETLRFVEVQLGSYFGEDDIKRYEDSYGRN